MHLADQRSARQIAINDHFKDIVVQILAGEVPVVVVGFVQKIKMVLPFHPADFHLHVKISRILLVADSNHRFSELVLPDRVGFRNNRPIGCVAINSRNPVGGKLKHLIFDFGTRQSAVQLRSALGRHLFDQPLHIIHVDRHRSLAARFGRETRITVEVVKHAPRSLRLIGRSRWRCQEYKTYGDNQQRSRAASRCHQSIHASTFQKQDLWVTFIS